MNAPVSTRDAYGVAARFANAEALAGALRSLRTAGYTRLEAYAPRPLEEVEQLLPRHRSPVPGVMLAAGAAGAAGAFLLQVWASYDYPLNVAGRPLFSWPAFVPVTFELTVLSAAFAGLVALLVIAQLPRLDHPMFNVSTFARASQDAYFVCVRGDDPRFDGGAVRALLHDAGGVEIEEVKG